MLVTVAGCGRGRPAELRAVVLPLLPAAAAAAASGWGRRGAGGGGGLRLFATATGGE